MRRTRRGVVVLASAGLLGLPAPAPATAGTGAVAVYADDPQTGHRTYDEAGGATVTATLTSPMNAFTVEAAQGGTKHKVTVTTTVPLAPGTFATGSQVTVTTDTCWYLSAGTLTVTRLTKDEAGALTELAASYDGWCGDRRWLGAVRYHSAEPWWGVHAPPVTFPDTLAGQSSSRDVTVTATGTQPVTLGTVAGVTAPYAVTADTCSGATLASGASCAVTVSFTPASPGWAPTTTVTLPADGPRGGVAVRLGARGVVPPAAPTGLRAVAGYDGIGLAWAPPPESWTYPAPTAYRVYRDGGAEPVATVTTTSYADPAAPGETHTYTVAAVAGGAGEGATTAAAGATVPADVTETTGDVTGVAAEGPYTGFATAAVTLPAAVPGAVTLSGGTGKTLTLRPRSGSAWAPGKVTATIDGNGCWPNVAELTVHEAKVRADGTPVTLAVSGTYPCGTGQTGYLELRYAARTPLVAADTEPDHVDAGWVDLGADPRVSTVTVANGGSVPLDLGTAVASADWTVSADGCSGTSVPAGGSCTVGVAFTPTRTGKLTGTLKIPDNTPRGHRSVRLAGTANGLPGAVRNLTVVPLIGKVEISYDQPVNAYPEITWYQTWRATSPDGPFTRINGVVSPYLRLTDTKVTPGQRLYYKVRAENSYGSGPFSETVSVRAVAAEMVYVADTGNGVYHLTGQGLPAGAARRLTTTAKDEEDPSFSADGTRLAFVREDVPGRFHLYRAAPDATAQWKVAGDVGSVAWTYRNPRWSPDHSRLAYACRPLTQTWWDLCVRNMVSGGVKKVPAVLANGGSWLPNGNELVVVSATAPPTIQVVAYDNSYRVAVPGTADARHAALAPDGSRIAWTRYEGQEGEGAAPRYSLRVSPLSGGAGVVLTGTGYSNDPAWSADGGTVYFTHAPRTPGAPATRDVWSAPATGGTPKRLTDTPTVDEDHVTVRDVVTPPASPQAARPMADFTGDGKADIAVWRPGTGAWRIRGLPTVGWGRLGDIPVAADYHGDRRAERAVFRPSTGTWHVYGRAAVKHGRPGDVPVPADYDGDGKAEPAVFRPSTGEWHVYGRAPVVYGKRGDVPVPADYNGDRKADIAVFRVATGTWAVRGRAGVNWDEGLPAPADYLGRGSAQYAVLRDDLWRVYAAYSTIAKVPRTHHDVVAYGDFNGDRRAEPGVFTPTLGLWRVLGQPSVYWGIPGDIPV